MPAIAAAAVSAITTVAGAASGAALALTGSATLAAGIGNAVMGLATWQGALTAAGLAASFLMQPQLGVEGAPTEWRADPTAGVPFALGRVAAAGRIVHRDEWGADNRYQSIWTVCSGAGPIQQIEGFYADDVAVSFGANGAASTGPYANKMWLQTKLGTSSDTALAQAGLDAATPGYEGWGAGQALPYRASCQLTLYQDSKFKSYPSGEPRTRLTLKGIKLYDPRLDSTVPGGSGSHRWGTPGTYAYSDNAALLALNWAMGLYEGSRLVGGIGAGSAGVHLPAFMEWANVCDANGWTASAYPSSLDDRHQVLLGLMQAGGARYARFAGKISCIVSAPKSSVVTLSVEDTAGPFEIATNADRLEKINTLVPTCRMESHNWEDVPQDEISVAAYVTADGGVIDRDLNYPYVALHADGSNRDQIAELAAYAILDSREPFSGTVPLKPWAMQIEPGDVFTITEPGFLLDGVELKCLTRSFDPMTNIVRVSFISESAGKHDFALGRTNTPPVPATLTVPDIYDVPPPDAGIYIAAPLPGRNPGIRVTAPTPPAIPHPNLIVYLRPSSDPGTGNPWSDPEAGWYPVSGSLDPATQQFDVTGVEPGTIYQVGVRYISTFGVIGAIRSLGSVATGDMVADDAVAPTADLNAAANIISEGRAALEDAASDMRASFAALADRGAHTDVTGAFESFAESVAVRTSRLEAPAENLITDAWANIGVELDWRDQTGAPATGAPKDGYKALQARADAAAAGEVLKLVYLPRRKVAAGEKYEINVKPTLSNATAAKVRLAIYAEESGGSETHAVEASLTSGARSGSFAAEVPASGYARFEVVATSAAGGEAVLEIEGPLWRKADVGQSVLSPAPTKDDPQLAVIKSTQAASARALENTLRLTIATENARASASESFLLKADKGGTLAGYNLTLNADFSALQTAVAGKANAADVFSKADANQRFLLQAGQGGTLAGYDLTLNAQFNSLQSSVDGKANAADVFSKAEANNRFLLQADDGGTLAGYDLTLNAQFNSLSSSAAITAGAVADIEGSAAFVTLEASASGGSKAAISLVDGAGGSQVDIVTERLVIKDPSDNSLKDAIVIQGGVLKAPSVEVDTVKAAVIDAEQLIGGAATEQWLVSSTGNVTATATVANQTFLMLSTPYQNRGVAGVGGASFRTSGLLVRTGGTGNATVRFGVRTTAPGGGAPYGDWTFFKNYGLGEIHYLSIEHFAGLIGEWWEVGVLVTIANVGATYTLGGGFVGAVELRR